VQFHWTGLRPFDDNSSLWMRVSQGWGGWATDDGHPARGARGAGAFLEEIRSPRGDRASLQRERAPVPHKLPDNKTVTSIRSASSRAAKWVNELTFEDARARELMFVHGGAQP